MRLRLLALAAAALLLVPGCFTPLMGGEQATGQRYVGILYETWFNHLQNDGHLTVPVYPDDPALNGRRYWATPALGTYLSTDRSVYQTHMDQLTDAGVDFLLVDYSNHNIMDHQLHQPIFTLLSVLEERVGQGKAIPQLVFLINNDEADLTKLWNEVYQPILTRSPALFAQLFFYYEGKPLICPTGVSSAAVLDQFTVRPMWGLLFPGDDRWSFMEPYPQRVAKKDGKAEQMAVSAAQQSSYMNETTTARGRNWSYSSQRNDGEEGENFRTQWKLALMVRPKFVIVKSWNEWIAYGPAYTDEFNREFSNDLEPMTGGHGDRYLQALKEYVGIFKLGSF